jgi:tetraacyldisaccharide-1-P 4'-kinase
VPVATDVSIARGSPHVSATLEQAIEPGGAAVPLAHLRGASFGLILTIARPARVIRTLARRDLVPAATIALSDHAHPSSADLERAAATKHRVKAWLTTPKCAVKLPTSVAGAPVLALDHRLDLPKALVDWALSEGPLPAAFWPSSPGQKAW